MVSTSREAFAARLSELTPAELAAFVADLWAARGRETSVSGRVVTVAGVDRPGERRVVAVGPEAEPGTDLPDAVDAVVAGEATPEAEALARELDADLLAAADLYEMVSYAVPRDVGEDLVDDHLGLDPTEEAAAEREPATDEDAATVEEGAGGDGEGSRTGGGRRADDAQGPPHAGPDAPGDGEGPREAPGDRRSGTLRPHDAAEPEVATPAVEPGWSRREETDGEAGEPPGGQVGTDPTPAGVLLASLRGRARGVLVALVALLLVLVLFAGLPALPGDGGFGLPVGAEPATTTGDAADPTPTPGGNDGTTAAPTTESGEATGGETSGGGTGAETGANRTGDAESLPLRYVSLRPNCERPPDLVVKIQLGAIRQAKATGNASIRTAYEFSSPLNRRFTGPLRSYVGIIWSDVYRPMLEYERAEYGPLVLDGDRATQNVTLVGPDGERHAYQFLLRRQTESPYAGCWMTRSVGTVPAGNLSSAG